MSLPIKFSSLKVAIVSAAAVLGIAAIGVLNWPTPQASVSHEEEEAGGPDKAFEWRRLAWLDENGQLATGALDRALAQRQKLLQTGTGTNKAGIDSGSWTFRGPSNVGGRTRSIVIDPRNTDRIFAGGVGGGIWRSTDGGQSWSPVNDQMESLAIACLTMDPQNPDVIYAGTGEGFFNSDAISGRGIWKTTDGGQTWNRLMSTGTWDNVCRIAVHPTDSNVVLACRRYGGIFRSTDAGASWTQVKSAQGSFFVAFNPQDGSKAVAHILDASGGWFHYAAYSSNAGATWNVSTGSLSNVSGFNSRLELAYAPSSPNIVYALAGNSGRVHKSTDGGQTFAQVTTSVSGNNTETGQLWYDNTIWVDPTNPNVLVLGAVHLYRSMDGGVTIGGSSTTTTSPSGRISNGYILTSQPHPDMHNIVSDPGYNGTTNRRVYIVNDGGVFRTDNILANRTSGYSNFAWTQLNNGYATSQFYGAAGHAGVDRIIGGLQDNGTLRVQGNNTQANLTFGGDGGWSAIDPTDPNYTYGEYVYLQIHRSTNGGASASSIYNGISDTGGSANFIAPFILDPNDPNVMLGGGRSLWRSTNVKATTPSWSAIRPAGSDNISAIAVAPGNSNIIWVAQNNGVVSKTTDGTTASPAWEVVDNNAGTNPLPNRYITRILIDPDNSNKVYVSTGGFTSDNLYRTVDGGATWTDITGNLPDAPIRGIARHPNNPNWLYVGTEVGIFATEDGGATWSTTNDGPATVSVDEVNFMHGSTTLLAATHGRGLWTSATEVAVLPDLTSFSLNPNSVIGGDPTSGIVTLSAAAPNGGAQVNLTSQSSAILPPSSITVPQGQTQATFTIGTAVVG
ncbi:MAG TPA: hypothetical protein VEX38_03745, partial [Fimbriimonadaceae bacterium]|nr:hypothetical protein [Fimbriimonadaceae bacterium]